MLACFYILFSSLDLWDLEAEAPSSAFLKGCITSFIYISLLCVAISYSSFSIMSLFIATVEEDFIMGSE